MKKTNLLLSILFCVFFGAMMLLFFIMPKQEFSQNEKRVLEKMSEFSFKSLADGSWFSQMDTYFSDHFFGRDFWVGLNAYRNQFIGLNSAGDIYKGKDGWLIEKPIQKNDLFKQNIQSIEQFVKSNENQNIYFMAVPTKGYVMQDKLPSLHDEYPDSQLLSQLKSLLGDRVGWIDVASTLKQNKDKDVFYKTDHHWTSEGAYLAYNKAGDVMGFKPKAKSEYNIESYDGFYGTSYSKSGLWETKPDKISLWEDKSQNVNVTITDDNMPKAITQDSVFFKDNLKEADKYPVFLDGNHSLVSLKSDAKSDKKLLVIRDSFAHCLSPFFVGEYSQIDLVDIRYYKKQTVSELINQNKYDDILFVYGLDTLATDRSLQWLE